MYVNFASSSFYKRLEPIVSSQQTFQCFDAAFVTADASTPKRAWSILTTNELFCWCCNISRNKWNLELLCWFLCSIYFRRNSRICSNMQEFCVQSKHSLYIVLFMQITENVCYFAKVFPSPICYAENKKNSTDNSFWFRQKVRVGQKVRSDAVFFCLVLSFHFFCFFCWILNLILFRVKWI